MTVYNTQRISRFITDKIELGQFCFFLQSQLGPRYDHRGLRGEIPTEKSIDLIQIATRDEQLGDLVYYLVKFWIEVSYGNPKVIRSTRLDEDLLMFYRELIEEGETEKAKKVQELLRELGVELAKTQITDEGKIQAVPGNRRLPLSIGFSPTADTTLVTWESAMGFYESTFCSPYDPVSLPAVLRALDAVQWTEYPKIGPSFDSTDRELLAACGLWKDERVVPDVHERVGRELYAALVSDREAQNALSTVRNHAAAAGLSPSYILRFPPTATEMAAHPWELLWDERGALLVDGRQQPSCVRHLLLPWALPEPSPMGSELRILALAPLAGISESVRDAERQERSAAWNQLITAGNVTMEELSPATPEALVKRIRKGPPVDIVHFYGHGRYRDGKGALLFDDPGGGKTWLAADQLAVALCDARLIMLHACHSSRVSDAGLLTGVAPALSAAGVPAVVAMQMVVRIEAATKFAGVVYQALACGESIQDAVSQARRDLFILEPDRASWYVPTLTICSRDTGPLRLLEPSGSLTRPG